MGFNVLSPSLSLSPSRSVGESACLLPARDYLTTQWRLREGDKSESFVEMVEGGGGWEGGQRGL